MKGLTKNQILLSISDFEEDHVITRDEIGRIFDRYSDGRLFRSHDGRITRMR